MGLAILVSIAATRVSASEVDSTPEPRHVIALIDTETQLWTREVEDKVHEMVEMPLNHLGLVVHRHDIRRGPPSEELLRDLRAVVTLFDYSKTGVEWLWPWLEELRDRGGIRFLHLGLFGPLQMTVDGKDDSTRLVRWLEGFGLGYDDYYVDVPLGIGVKYIDPALCAYESDPKGRAVHQGPWLLDDRNVAWVTTTIATDTRERAGVLVGDWGAVALQPWLFVGGSGHGDRRWHLDPFAFFCDALGLRAVPAAHPCVLNGRRMFFCHVDGDGFESISTVLYGKICGRVFIDEILDRYDLPFTLSVIIGSLTRDYEPEKPTPAMNVARRVLNHPKVEAASHTVLHPYDWRGVESGIRDPDYQAFAPIPHFKQTALNEVTESIRFIDRWLMEEGRRCEIMLWSGDATPPEHVVRACADAGCLNINSGVYRWDPLFDSVGFVSPWGRAMETAIQVYCGAANENIYDGFFEEMPASFRHVDRSIERTGSPRILKPANIYIHFYSVERPGRLRTLHTLLRRWGLNEPTAPVFATTYAAAVTSAMSTARTERTPMGWRFFDFGACRTVRIDDEPRDVDWQASRGLLGACRRGPSLYLHLAEPDAEVVLSTEPAVRPHVLEANCLLDDASLDERGVRVTARSIAKREIVFAGFPPGAPVVVRIDDTETEARTEAGGTFRLVLPAGPDRRVEVTEK